MYRYANLLLSALVALSVVSGPVHGQIANRSLLYRSTPQRFGLDRQWFTQARVDPGQGRLTHVTPHVSSRESYRVFEVMVGGAMVLRVSDQNIDTLGRPLGREGAERTAVDKVLDLIGDLKDTLPLDELREAERITKMLETIQKDEEKPEQELPPQMAAVQQKSRVLAGLRQLILDGKIDELTQRAKSPPASPIELIKHDVPQVTLYVTTNTGLVQALDGETGGTRWTTAVGSRDFLTLSPAASDRYVAIINGSSVYLLDSATGEEVWSRAAEGVPGAGPAVGDDFIFVPTLTGIMESFAVADAKQRPRYLFSRGRLMVSPTIAAATVAWPTDQGTVYLADASKVQLAQRIEAVDPIVSQVTYYPANNWFISTSLSGHVYCIRERDGKVVWRFSTGTPISRSAFPVDDSIYAITDDNELFQLNMTTGEEQWVAPQIVGFIAASKDRVYCETDTGRTQILDRKTGGRIATLPTETLDLKLANTLTDRIYVGTTSGFLACVRETQQRWPLVHAGIAEVKQKPTVVVPAEPAAGTEPPPPPLPAAEQADPFAPRGGQNPFPPQPPPPPADNDPFRVNNNPNPAGAGPNQNPFDAPADNTPATDVDPFK